MSNTDDKYITFPREAFLEMVGQWMTQDMSRRQVPMVLAEVALLTINDAVVIRRQDLFASPCLATYANMIALVGSNITDKKQGDELLAIADYFQRQAELAAAEGWHLPTL
jgi:hypothetical protein